MDVTVVSALDNRTSTLKTSSMVDTTGDGTIRPTAWGDTPFNTIKKDVVQEEKVVSDKEDDKSEEAEAPTKSSSSSGSSVAEIEPPKSPKMVSSTFVNLEKPVSPRISPLPTKNLSMEEPVELGVPPANASTATESDVNLVQAKMDDTGNELSDVNEEPGLKARLMLA